MDYIQNLNSIIHNKFNIMYSNPKLYRNHNHMLMIKTRVII